jgi:hypothetical protein
MNREAIINALFGLLSNSADFVTKSRRLQLSNSLGGSEKPALFLSENSEVYVRGGHGIPAIITINVDVYIYIDAGKDPNVIPATTLNNLIDAIDLALKPDAISGVQNLGGLVSHCHIEGKIVKEAGDLDGDGFTIIPVKILVN